MLLSWLALRFLGCWSTFIWKRAKVVINDKGRVNGDDNYE